MRFVFAYLDPGSASIVFQAVIAAIIAIPVLFRNKIAAAIRAVRGAGRTDSPGPAADASSTDTTPR